MIPKHAMPLPALLSGLKARLWLEFLSLFVGLPLLVLAIKDRMAAIGLLWLGAVLATAFLYRHANLRWNGQAWAGLRAVLARFCILAPLIGLLTWFFLPESFLSFPRERPQLWIMVMLLYPLLSVWPQEVLYRAFLYHRYAPLFGREAGFIAASALAFGFMHVILLNWVAVIMTMLGGYLFAQDYARTRSLTLACIEHALYGCLVFTIGLGRFFFSGAAWN